ncbi:MAG: hypothetical protein A3C43_03695 [Candidatus Schekmanbacteria bacterium RIFCSPHIGHO2_02_FULL_38_11]|uniref:Glycosyl transferase family 1 domain-containing protein n=1 Tax=Candidatus Schekmanbacteria bacterium RIFCSPLOWO2_12_FULL_38_15 TaxID=1817883 RepID=A0A1F7SNT0_9BACT|nr:MAG: hypothetical protein A2043_02825 [Candidatus Schekmanbacteria bacterium GWA2_38_9]OGL50266.1 MAG: hypothetical protein A3H37_00745 [Candidatus Schekmanbacteria bacterium RIFCSPLOWO2_02_FULL_38_14]OGL52321.1 MAG: hypothetical protein A3C43_03695 [Candidatus Schekmanbacteria bacterium RIFCSPHIGHO2_02_FULL_38_11]OGL55423.1 MAG: hypothetical protein A3G31_01255 [Candidatus Schekmanbacteria bacterium RIFCSPLOWO2_12_FULL_38_15]
MKKIAFIDLLFHWPPTGGSWLDVKEIASGLKKRGFDVKLFVPLFNEYFPRGKIEGTLPFQVTTIPFNRFTFNPYFLTKRIKKEIDVFKPNFIFLSDGYFLKPYLSNALREYPKIFRFYAYELICLNNKLFFDMENCENNFLANSGKCIKCQFPQDTPLKMLLKVILNHRKDEHPFNRIKLHRMQEFISSLAFSKKYPDILKKSLKEAKAIIVYNNFLKNLLSGINRNILVVPSGVDPESFYPEEIKKEDNKKIILMVGRLAEYAKGVPVLELAFKLLLAKRDDIKLCLTTDQYFSLFHKRFQGDKFSLINWVNHEELASLYQKSDICVVPSVWREPFGITALEAMACGKPVIASKTGGLELIVEDGKTGFLFEPGNVEELMQKLELLLDDENLRNKMGEEGRKRAEELFSWDNIIEKYYLPLFV